MRGCCYDDSVPNTAWCFEPSYIADSGFVEAAFTSPPLPAELGMSVHNLSLPRHCGGGLDGTDGVRTLALYSLLSLQPCDSGQAVLCENTRARALKC